MKDIASLAAAVTSWTKSYANTAGVKTLVVGVSGGVDSATVERLCEATGYPTIAVAMPMYLHSDSAADSLEKAIELCQGRKNVRFFIREIGPIVEAYLARGIANHPHMVDDANRLLQGNVRSRIRANILYDFAGAYRGLVVGTGNKDEDEIGYFTKGGDGLVDLCPFSMLHKSTVCQLAEYWEVPQRIITAKPTAGLWDGQTDEDELGMTYAEVAWALDYEDGFIIPQNELNKREQEVLTKVRNMRDRSTHKRQYPPIFCP